MKEANETMRKYMSEIEKDDDKRTFLHNLAWLLRQTREPIRDIILIRNGSYALIEMEGGATKEVSISGDSYFQIVKDIMRVYQL